MKKICIIVIVVTLLSACNSREVRNTHTVSNVQTKTIEAENKANTETAQTEKKEKAKIVTLAEEKEIWIKKFNEKDQSIRAVYDKKASIIFNNKFIENKDLENYFPQLLSVEGEISARTVLDTKEYDKTRVIEKGEFTIGNKKMCYFNVWEKTKKNWYITVELIYNTENENIEIVEMDKLDEVRNKYTELGHTKDIEGFVKNIFDENGAYFHNGEFCIGNNNIYKSFSANLEGSEGFSMRFEKEKITATYGNTVIDYGKYFNNDVEKKYLFVWKRQPDNNWKVYLDLCVF